MSKLDTLITGIKKTVEFVTDGVWRISEGDVSPKKKTGYTLIKVISLAVRRFIEDNLQNQASALTYSTLLSIVPILAVLLSIAKGFGFQNIIESQLFDYFPGQRDALTRAFSFVGSYLEQAKSGYFLGFGIVLLLYTILNLISNVENSFNSIWQVKKGRSYYRKITDYFSLLLLSPIFIVLSAGLSIFISTTMDTFNQYHLIAPIYEFLLKLIPFVVTISAFTFIYIYIPNTKVKFTNALVAGIIAGIGFQIFQYLYINGQIWVSKYNAIYGSFAVLPLLLLWLQLSWTVCLLGAEIAYAAQNVKSYEFEADSKNISRRYMDFLMLLITTIIVKRFEEGKAPYTAEEISVEYKIPIRLTTEIIYELIELKVINEVRDDDLYERNYQPALDIHKITVGFLLSLIDSSGSENFKIDKEIEFNKEWNEIIKSREAMYDQSKDILLKDL